MIVSIVILTMASLNPDSILAISSSAGNRLGYSVSAYGNTVAVGAPEDDQNGTYSGSVSIFENGVFHQTLYAFSPDAGDNTGISVSLQQDVVAVGASGYAYTTTKTGAVFVYRRSGGVWTNAPEDRIFAPDAKHGDAFGYTVAIHGNLLVVGAPARLLSHSYGVLYIFRWNGSSWVHEKAFNAPDYSEHYAKYALSVYDNTVVVGADGTSCVSSHDGVVYIYEYNAVWDLEQTLSPSDAAYFFNFGKSVSIYDDTIVIGCPNDGAGSAYIFNHNGSSWIETQKITPSDGETGDRFGYSVSLYGRQLVVGAPFKDYDKNPYESDPYDGAAYLFANKNGWAEKAKLDSGAYDDDKIGMSVSIYNDKVYVGGPDCDVAGTDSGICFLYTIQPEPMYLSFTVQPSSIVLSDYLSTSVSVLDQYGSLFTESRSINVGLSNNPTGASLLGTVTKTTSGGSASFSLGVSKEGTGYTLIATSSGLDSDISSSFNVSSDPASKFVILNPQDGTVDSPITVTIQAQNEYGSKIPTYNEDVMLVVSGSAAGGGLVNIVNGEGTRTISNTVPETVALTLQDTMFTGLNVTSSQDVVFFVGEAYRLFFEENPTDVLVSTAISPPIVVSILDQFDNRRSDSGIPITLSVYASTSSLSGDTTVLSQIGESIFSNVKIADTGNFVLTAKSGSLIPTESAQFEVTSSGDGDDNDLVYPIHSSVSDDSGCSYSQASSTSVISAILGLLFFAFISKRTD